MYCSKKRNEITENKNYFSWKLILNVFYECLLASRNSQIPLCSTFGLPSKNQDEKCRQIFPPSLLQVNFFHTILGHFSSFWNHEFRCPSVLVFYNEYKILLNFKLGNSLTNLLSNLLLMTIKKSWSDKRWPVQGSSSQKYSQMSKKIEVKATKKKGRMLVAKEQIEPGKHFFMRFPIRIGFQDFMKSDLIFYKSTFQRGILAYVKSFVCRDKSFWNF